MLWQNQTNHTDTHTKRYKVTIGETDLLMLLESLFVNENKNSIIYITVINLKKKLKLRNVQDLTFKIFMQI